MPWETPRGERLPTARASIGVEGDLEDSILPFHADGLVLLGVILELGHS